jgi:hypothetical protein
MGIKDLNMDITLEWNNIIHTRLDLIKFNRAYLKVYV